MIIKDKDGNILEVSQYGDTKLTLVGKRPKFIGSFQKDGDKNKFTTTRKQSHIFKKTNAWGINHVLLTLMKPTEQLQILANAEGRIYELTAGEIEDKGDFLHFKTEGFERQLFVPRNQFRITKLI